MKQFIILVVLFATVYGAKMPVEHTPVPVVSDVDKTVVTTEVTHPVHHGGEHHGHQNVPHVEGVEGQKVPVPHVPPHVQHIVQQAHQHIPQVVNHHIGTKKTAPQSQQHVQPHVPHVGDHVTVPTPTSATHQQQHGHEQQPQQPHVTPSVVNKIEKVKEHVQMVMQQAHHHIPQVVNHHIAEHGHHSSTTHAPHVEHSVGHVGEKVTTAVPVVSHHHHHVEGVAVVHHPVVTVKTTAL